MDSTLRIDGDRLLRRLDTLALIGAIDGGGCCRLALTDADKAGRDLVSGWMRALGLQVRIDRTGNVIGLWQVGSGAPVMTGSHIDTVRTGGRYDGNYGVIAGLEVIETLQAAGIRPARPLAVAFFTNEEGSRFTPDMMGSLAYAGGMPVEAVLEARDRDGRSVGAELARIGYAGDMEPGSIRPHAFIELHIEQGPVLDRAGITIGTVEDLQGISWTEIAIDGQSNHAGTTPMDMRRDAGFAAAAVAVELRRIALEMGPPQVATAGSIAFHPGYINVVPARATVTADLRNTDEARLADAEARLAACLERLRREEGVTVTARSLVRLAPVRFDPRIVALVEANAGKLGLSVRRITSGAGHDAQMMARLCPTGMIFVPSRDGVSHNPAEHTEPGDLIAGADLLLRVMLDAAA